MRKRVLEMDMARAIATIAVLVIHISNIPLCGAFHPGTTSLICISLYAAARFAVPIFVVLSGMGLTLSQRPNEDYFRFLKRRVSKLIFGYLLWSLIYTLFYSKSTGRLGWYQISPGVMASNIITGQCCYHLYFVPRVLLLYALFPLVHTWFKRGRYVAVAYMLVTALTLILHFGLHKDVGQGMLSLLVATLRWLPYFGLGIWMATDSNTDSFMSDWSRKLVAPGMLLYVAFMIYVGYRVGVRGNSMEPVFPIMKMLVAPYAVIIAVWIWTRDWPSNLAKPLLLVSKYSYGIYLSHVLVLLVFDRIYHFTAWANPLNSMIVIAAALAFSFAGSLAISMVSEVIKAQWPRAVHAQA